MIEVSSLEQLRYPTSPEAKEKYLAEALEFFPPETLEATGAAANHLLDLVDERIVREGQPSQPDVHGFVDPFILALAFQKLKLAPGDLPTEGYQLPLKRLDCQPASQVLYMSESYDTNKEDDNLALTLACLGASLTVVTGPTHTQAVRPFPAKVMKDLLGEKFRALIPESEELPGATETFNATKFDIGFVGNMALAGYFSDRSDTTPNNFVGHLSAGYANVVRRLNEGGTLLFTREGQRKFANELTWIDPGHDTLKEWQEQGVIVRAYPRYILAAGTYEPAIGGTAADTPTITIEKVVS